MSTCGVQKDAIETLRGQLNNASCTCQTKIVMNNYVGSEWFVVHDHASAACNKALLISWSLLLTMPGSYLLKVAATTSH